MERDLYAMKMEHRRKSLEEALSRNTTNNRMLLLIISVGDTPKCVREAFYVDTVNPDALPPHGPECRCTISPMSERAFFLDNKRVRQYGLPK